MGGELYTRVHSRGGTEGGVLGRFFAFWISIELWDRGVPLQAGLLWWEPIADIRRQHPAEIWGRCPIPKTPSDAALGPLAVLSNRGARIPPPSQNHRNTE